MTSAWWVGQFLGVVAVGLSVYALTMANDSKHRVTNASGSVVDALHWVLLSAYAAGAVTFLVALRVATAEIVQTSTPFRKMSFACGYSAAFIVASLLTWVDAFSAFPMAAAVVATFAFMFRGGVELRVWLIICNVPWVIYSIHILSLGGLLSALLAIGVLIHTITRMRRA